MSIARKIFPHPWLTLLLAVTWPLVNNSFAPGHMVLGGILAVLIPIVTSSFWPEPVALQCPGQVIKYATCLALDILTANLQVAVWIIRPNRQLRPAFLRYELELSSPMAISLLANTISLTPGTVSCDLSTDQRYLLIHSLHTDDADGLAQKIQRRYESPLLKILKQC